MGANQNRRGGISYELGAETITNSVKLVVLKIINNSMIEFAREALKGVIEGEVAPLTASAVA